MKKKNNVGLWWESQKKGVNGRIILKFILEKQDWVTMTRLVCFKIRSSESFVST
jgi:hypothetical protein